MRCCVCGITLTLTCMLPSAPFDHLWSILLKFLSYASVHLSTTSELHSAGGSFKILFLLVSLFKAHNSCT